MDTELAFANAQANMGNTFRVFDWELAARMIKERKPQTASAGLGRDWEYTGGVIFASGKPITDASTYLASNWAIPELDMDGVVCDCWRYADATPGWHSGTVWPAEALAILNA